MSYYCQKCMTKYLAPGKCVLDQYQLRPLRASVTAQIISAIASDPETFRSVVKLGCYLVKKIL